MNLDLTASVAARVVPELSEGRTAYVPIETELSACLKAWPDCESGEYHPSCCRFPKSCSAPDESVVPERWAMLEAPCPTCRGTGWQRNHGPGLVGSGVNVRQRSQYERAEPDCPDCSDGRSRVTVRVTCPDCDDYDPGYPVICGICDGGWVDSGLRVTVALLPVGGQHGAPHLVEVTSFRQDPNGWYVCCEKDGSEPLTGPIDLDPLPEPGWWVAVLTPEPKEPT